MVGVNPLTCGFTHGGYSSYIYLLEWATKHRYFRTFQWTLIPLVLSHNNNNMATWLGVNPPTCGLCTSLLVSWSVHFNPQQATIKIRWDQVIQGWEGRLMFNDGNHSELVTDRDPEHCEIMMFRSCAHTIGLLKLVITWWLWLLWICGCITIRLFVVGLMMVIIVRYLDCGGCGGVVTVV